MSTGRCVELIGSFLLAESFRGRGAWKGLLRHVDEFGGSGVFVTICHDAEEARRRVTKVGRNPVSSTRRLRDRLTLGEAD